MNTSTRDSHQRIVVPLAGRDYDVLVGDGLLDRLGPLVADVAPPGGRCAVITDSVVGPLYAAGVVERLSEAGIRADVFEIPAGEHSKSMGVAEDLCRRMLRTGHDRGSFVIALGGGVVGDLGGFVAAIFQRGVPYLQIPTTVVAQVDSSVGGKTGVNTPEGKNLVGAFNQPLRVIADPRTLDTLSARAYNEGFAEIIKHAAIRDAAMLDRIDRHAGGAERSGLAALVAANVAIKAAIVAEDERETTGARALLNFGHTIGHGIEASAGFGEMMHGEAVALGLIAAARLSVRRAGLPDADAERLRQLLGRFDLPLALAASIPTVAVREAMARDKKFQRGAIRFVLLRALGDAIVSDAVTPGDLDDAIEGLRD